jgi:hypothetical protein
MAKEKCWKQERGAGMAGGRDSLGNRVERVPPIRLVDVGLTSLSCIQSEDKEIQ